MKGNAIEEKKEQLKEELKVISFIYYTAKMNYDYALYFFGGGKTPFENLFLRNNNEINFISHSLWKMCVIDLVKLVSKSNRRDKYALEPFLLKFKTGGDYSGLGFNQKFLERHLKIINKYEEVIFRIIDIRDTSYAHTDKKRKKEENNFIATLEVAKALKYIDNILSKIYKDIFQAEFKNMYSNLDASKSLLLEALANYHPYQKKIIDERNNK